jgi:hypothetical protein
MTTTKFQDFINTLFEHDLLDGFLQDKAHKAQEEIDELESENEVLKLENQQLKLEVAKRHEVSFLVPKRGVE